MLTIFGCLDWIPIFEFGRKEYQKIEKLDLQSRVAMRERWATNCCCCCWSFLLQITTYDCAWMLSILGYDCCSIRSDLIRSVHCIFNGFGNMNASDVSWRRRRRHRFRLRFLCHFYCCHALCVDLSMDHHVCIRFFWSVFFSESMLCRLATNDRAPNIYVCVLCRHSLEDWPKF